MNPWMTDARESLATIKAVDEINDDLIEYNDAIDSFINEDIYHIVNANKGFGKSLCLLSKRKQLNEMIMIPEHYPLDVPSLHIEGLDNESFARISERKTLTLIWSMSIVIAIIKRLKIHEEIDLDGVSGSLRNLLSDVYQDSVASLFTAIIVDINRREFYEELTKDYDRILLPVARKINQPVAVFIDNIDECFDDYRQLPIWQEAQISIVIAIYDLIRINPNFKLYASIINEAYIRITDSMSLQYNSVKIDLSYTKQELKDIFIKNILMEKSTNLVYPAQQKNNPIYAFLGMEKIEHGFADVEEDLFDYIYRHTFKRPRDLMEIGKAITKLKIIDRHPETKEGLNKIKSAINEASAKIAQAYLSEMLYALSIEDADMAEFYNETHRNTLKRGEVQSICAKLNKTTIPNCNGKECKDCGNKHVFCDLFRIGLIGCVKKSPFDKDRSIQAFNDVGMISDYATAILPKQAKYFILHPAFSELVRSHNNSLARLRNDVNIIGYDNEWVSIPTTKKKSLNPKDMITKNRQVVLAELRKEHKQASILDKPGTVFGVFPFVAQEGGIIRDDKNLIALLLCKELGNLNECKEQIADFVSNVNNPVRRDRIKEALIIIESACPYRAEIDTYCCHLLNGITHIVWRYTDARCY